MTNFSRQQVKMFKKLFAHPPIITGGNKPEKFILQFVLFEASVRLVGNYYRNRSTQKKKSNAHAPLNTEVVKRSFAYFCIHVSSSQLDMLLDSSLTTRNLKSARNLRNALVHNWKAGDVAEVKNRDETLSNALNQAINAIKARIA